MIYHLPFYTFIVYELKIIINSFLLWASTRNYLQTLANNIGLYSSSYLDDISFNMYFTIEELILL